MLLLAVMANATMDTLAYRYHRSVFTLLGNAQWFDPSLSWKNKWKNGDPSKGNAFPGSSTVFVAATDAWHFAKSLCIASLLMALLAPFTLHLKQPWWIWVGTFFALQILWGLLFESLFAGLFISR